MSFKVPSHSIRPLGRTHGPYVPPPWAAPPSPGLSLIVIRSGVILQELPLTTPSTFLVLGRAPDVDIPVAHASLSRYHAIFQFGQSKVNSAPLYVYDLGSVHGTFVNKTRIKAETLVPVYDGDFIKFGESTRDYVVSARSSAKSEVLDVIRRKSAPERTAAEKNVEEQSAEAHDNVGVLWGLEEVDPLVSKRDEYTEVGSFGEESLSANQQKQWERLKGTRRKLANIITERERILEKEAMGLTQGQRQRLSVLVEKIATLSSQIEEAEVRIKAGRTVSSQHESKDVSFTVSRKHEEELFYDWAQEKSRKKMKLDPVETEVSLHEKLCTHEKLLSKAKLLLSQNMRRWERLPETVDEDTLDSYMAHSRKDLQREEVEKSRKEVENLTETVLRLRKLVEAISDRGSGISSATAGERTRQETNPKEGADPKVSESRLQTANLPKLSFSADAVKSIRNSAAVKKPKNHKCEPLESLTQKRKGLRARDVNRPRVSPKPLEMNPYSGPLKDDNEVWQPPPDQTGDGRTHLNDELGY